MIDHWLWAISDMAFDEQLLQLGLPCFSCSTVQPTSWYLASSVNLRTVTLPTTAL